MMTSKDTIDKLNRLEFFYWCKPTRTPEMLEQDREQTKRDFALIRKDLEVLEILKDKLDIAVYEDKINNIYIMFLRFSKYGLTEEFKISKREHELLKEWLENEIHN